MLRYKEIKNLLTEEISRLRPSDRLPSRPELCERLDTTRTTLDKAIKELEKEGLLVSKLGSGTYIASLMETEKLQPGSWGIIVPSVTLDTYPALVRGVENVTQLYDVNLILCNSDNDMEKQERYISRLLVSGVSGFIIVPVITQDPQQNTRLYNQLIDTRVPFIFCNRSIEGIDVPVVTSSSYYGGYIATKHLIARGYKRIAYISVQKYRTSEERCHGYISALIESGIEIDRTIVVMKADPPEGENDGGRLPGYREMKRLLAGEEPVDAVFCFNDKVAEGVYQAIKEAGLKISGDIGVIGYDNTDVSSALFPPLTSVSYKSDEIGEMAANLLYKMLNGEKLSDFSSYLFHPEIVLRSSCLEKGGARP